MVTLDVGCGERPRGDINVDLIGTSSIDVKCSITHLPFRARTFEEVFCSHVLEHVSRSKLNLAVSELKRVGENITVWIPYGPHDRIHTFLFNRRIGHKHFFRLRELRKWGIPRLSFKWWRNRKYIRVYTNPKSIYSPWMVCLGLLDLFPPLPSEVRISIRPK